jgi:hypothetical protein
MARIETVNASTDARKTAPSARSRAPVFVMGCHRSGTNLLYDTLLSAGGFAVYRGYLPVYKLLVPRFGSLHQKNNRQKLLRVWLKSESFRRSGLPENYIQEQVLDHCRNGGDFIRITMDEMARRQNVGRWAVYDPDAVLYLNQIKAEIPDALFVHIVRDGRDVAMSLEKMGGFRPFPWNRRHLGLEETAIYWRWMVEKGRRLGIQISPDYLEVHYEELVSEPESALKKLGEFIDHDLNYERIRQSALGRIREPNSSFVGETESAQPVGRWKENLTREQVARIESAVGETLEEFGYPLTIALSERRATVKSYWMRSFFPAFLNTKLFLKTRTPLGRFANLEPLHPDVAE